ncbi:MAG: CIA30 family protein [Xanthobacteraceae bacterium]|nr:CIA30 family protein [Xanthobacteraceae bacterium]
MGSDSDHGLQSQSAVTFSGKGATTLEIWPANPNHYWRLVTDAVMGGVSRGSIAKETLESREAIRLRGDVSTENNGGFVQIALDLAPETGSFDAGGFTGLEMDVLGNHESYGAHLRTTDNTRPQQSYRQSFVTTSDWQTLQLPFVQFMPHRIDIPLDVRRLRRIGLVAIGRDFSADLAVARLAFY